MKKDKEFSQLIKGFTKTVAPMFDLSDGACRDEDPEVFFPDRNNPSWHKAKAICDKCPVRMQCLQWAIENNEQHGIWGGMVYRERLQHKRKYKRVTIKKEI